MESLTSAILMEIGDEENRRYYTKAAQWAIDAFRDLNIGYSPFYYERKVTLDPSLYTGDYPNDLVKLLSVGIYLNGEFWPFTEKPNMAMMPPDAEDNIYVGNTNETSDVPEKGYTFGYNGSNIGYWANDPENCRFIVKNFKWNTNNGSYLDTTSDIVTKVVIRYKTTGIDCGKDLRYLNPILKRVFPKNK